MMNSNSLLSRRSVIAAGITALALIAGPALAEDSMTIRDGELSVLINSASPPTSFIENGEPKGMAVDLAEELARRLDLKPTFKAYADLAGVLPAISNKQHDIAAVGMMRTPQREEVVDFSGAWYYGWFPLMVDRSSGIKGYDDLNGKIVGTVSGSIQERWMQDNHPEIQISSFPNDISSIAALNAGSVDGALTGSALLKDNLERFPNLDVAAKTPVPYPNAFPILKGNKELKEKVDAALADMMADGTYVKVFDKWHAGDTLPEPLYDDYPSLADVRAKGETQ